MQTNVQQQNEQVYLISNYSAFPTTAAVSVVIDHGRPTAGQAPSIVGGFVNRGPADPFLNGRYICFIVICCSKLSVLMIIKALINPYLLSYCPMDAYRYVYIYNSSIWATAKTPASNAGGLHAYPSARIPDVRCSESSLVPCGGKAIAGSIVFLGQDSSMDIYIITTGSIYRVIPPGLCAGSAPPPAPPQQMPPWLTWLISILGLVFLVAIPTITSCLCGGAGPAAGQPPNWHFSLSCCSWNCCSSGTTS